MKRKYVVNIRKDKQGRYILVKGKKYRIQSKDKKRISKAIVKKLAPMGLEQPRQIVWKRRPRKMTRPYNANRGALRPPKEARKKLRAIRPDQPLAWTKDEREDGKEETLLEKLTKPPSKTEKEKSEKQKIQEEERKQRMKDLELARSTAIEAGMKVKPNWSAQKIWEKLTKLMKELEDQAEEEPSAKPLSSPEPTPPSMSPGIRKRVKDRQENEEILLNLGKDPSEYENLSDTQVKLMVKRAIREQRKSLKPPPRGGEPKSEVDPLSLGQRVKSMFFGKPKPATASETKATTPLTTPETKTTTATAESLPPPTAPERTTSWRDVLGGGKVSKDGLSNHQIDDIMKKYPEYLGTIASDEIESRIIPKIKPLSRGCFIINTKPSHHRGEHWQAVYFDARPTGAGTIEFFDSYGDEAEPHILKGLKSLAEKLDAKTYLKFKENRVEKQGDSNNCGFFCCQFLIDRLRGKPFVDATGWKDTVGGEREVANFKTQHGFGYMSSFGEQHGGLFGIDIGRALSNTVSAVRNLFYPSSKMPNSARAVLEKYGRNNISRIQCRRAPVIPAVEKFLNIISLGQYEKGKAEANYDKMFHLGMVVHLFTGPKILVEKNETINITTSFSDDKNTEYIEVPLGGRRDLTLNEMMKKTEDYMGTFYFYQYNSFSNNCQRFIKSILTANGLNNPTLTAWVEQPVDTIVKRLPSFVGKVAQFATDTWAKIKQIFGRGRRGKKKAEKFRRVMREFKQGKLYSSSGKLVTNPKQAVAIAFHSTQT